MQADSWEGGKPARHSAVRQRREPRRARRAGTFLQPAAPGGTGRGAEAREVCDARVCTCVYVCWVGEEERRE